MQWFHYQKLLFKFDMGKYFIYIMLYRQSDHLDDQNLILCNICYLEPFLDFFEPRLGTTNSVKQHGQDNCW